MVQAIGGTGGADWLTGTIRSDELFGLDGDDFLDALDGHDLLVGGNGRDVLLGGAGMDELRGGRGNDHLDGGRGRDYLQGGLGQDTLVGGGGDDVLSGGENIDTAVFSGNRSDYAISRVNADEVRVASLRTDADGTDYLAADVERIRFADGEFTVTDLAGPPDAAPGGLSFEGRARRWAADQFTFRLAEVGSSIDPVDEKPNTSRSSDPR